MGTYFRLRVRDGAILVDIDTGVVCPRYARGRARLEKTATDAEVLILSERLTQYRYLSLLAEVLPSHCVEPAETLRLRPHLYQGNRGGELGPKALRSSQFLIGRQPRRSTGVLDGTCCSTDVAWYEAPFFVVCKCSSS